MSKYGNIFTTSDYAEALKKSNRDYHGKQTWSQMYAATDIAAQQAESAIKYNYAQEVADAYSSAIQEKTALYDSNLGTGYKSAGAQDIDDALSEAYDTYYNNYLSNVSSIEQSKATAQTQITDILTQQAENTKAYEQAHIDYVKYLYDKLAEGELTEDVVDKDGKIITKGNLPKDLFNELGWSRFIVTDKDEKGNVTQRLMTDDEIRNMMYDEQGQLTLKGVDIYDMIENDLSARGYKSFGSYLAEQDEINDTSLAEWAMSYNPFDYTEDGTNAASFQKMLNFASKEDKYSFAERFGGLSETEITNMLDEYKVQIDEIAKLLDNNANLVTIKTAVDTYVKDVFDLLDKFELTEDMTKAGYDREQMSKAILDRLSTYNAWRNKLGEYDMSTQVMAEGALTTSMVAGTGMGVGIGSANPMTMLIGGLIGLVVGGIVGYIGQQEIYSARYYDPQRTQLAQYVASNAQNTEDAMLNMLSTIVAYSKQKQAEVKKGITFGK